MQHSRVRDQRTVVRARGLGGLEKKLLSPQGKGRVFVSLRVARHAGQPDGWDARGLVQEVKLHQMFFSDQTRLLVSRSKTNHQGRHHGDKLRHDPSESAADAGVHQWC